jgi:hypothetical protein
VGQLQHPYQELGHGRRAVFPGQISRIGSGDQSVINKRQPVADAFEALPHRHLLVVLQLIKSAVFGGVDEVGECGIEGVEGFIHHRALVAFCCCGVPELHAPIVLESVFDNKLFPQQNKES